MLSIEIAIWLIREGKVSPNLVPINLPVIGGDLSQEEYEELWEQYANG